MVDGKPYTLYVHYGHATPDSFSNVEVGDTLEVGQEIGKIGGTGKWAADKEDTYSKHLDLRGWIWKDGKRVHISPSEFVPLGPQEHRERQRFDEGGEVNAFKIPDLIPVDARGDRQGKQRKVTKQERADVQKLWGTYSPEAKKNLLDRFQRGTLSASQVAGEMIQ